VTSLAQRPSLPALTSQLVQIPSVNPMGRQLDSSHCFEHRLTDFLAGLFSDWGLRFERHVVVPASGSAPPRENILAELPGQASFGTATDSGATKSILMLEVHQDTVPVDGMTIPPWSGEIRAGRIHGRGSCDIKGGMASVLTAVSRLQQLPSAERPTIVIACTMNEEHGFTGATHLRQLWQSGTSKLLPRAPDAIIVTEPTLLDVVVAHKGCIRWKCHTRGVATHSSQPQEGENAIYAMSPVVAALEAFARDVAPTIGEHSLLTPSTLSVGTIQGGVSVNTVPDHCEIQIDLRVLPGQDPHALRQQAIEFVLSQLADASKVTFEEPNIAADGLSDEHNGVFAESLAKTIRAKGHPGQLIGVAYGTDAAGLAVEDIPTVVFGPGSIAQAHTKDEWVSIEQLEQATEILYEFARNLPLADAAH